MLDIRFRGLPFALMGMARPPHASNANAGLFVPEAVVPVIGLPWLRPVPWVPIRPRSSRKHLTVVK